MWWRSAVRDRIHIPLQWRHNGRDGVSNHQLHHCLLNRLVRHRWKKTSKPRVTGLCARNSPVTGESLAQMANNAENVSIWWRHHATCVLVTPTSATQTMDNTLYLQIIFQPWVRCDRLRRSYHQSWWILQLFTPTVGKLVRKRLVTSFCRRYWNIWEFKG